MQVIFYWVAVIGSIIFFTGMAAHYIINADAIFGKKLGINGLMIWIAIVIAFFIFVSMT